MMVIETLIILISVCVLWTQTFMQDWKSVILFLFVLSLCHYVLKTPVYVAFRNAGILSCIMNMTYSRETFKNNNEEKDDEDDTDDKDDTEDEDDTDDEENDVVDEEDTDDKEDNVKNNNPIDMGETIKDALQNFDPKTLKNMTKDTTSLIKSQTELMNIIQQMRPVISKGLSLVDKFHGDGKTEKLFEQYNQLKKLQNSTK